MSQSCSDACQCGGGLSCYAPNDNSTVSGTSRNRRITSGTLNSQAPYCKIALSADIRTGYYLNHPSTAFNAAAAVPPRLGTP